jgi:hypothetical protein
MVRDSITDEIRAVRHALAAKFDNDLDLILADVRRQEVESGRKYVTLPKRVPRTPQVAEPGDAPESGVRA